MENSAGLIFDESDWWLAVVVLLLGGIFVVAWGYRSVLNRGNSTSSFLAAALKILAFAALAACLLNPKWRSKRAQPGANLIAAVVDNSQSMQISPPAEKISRAERLQAELAPQTEWQTRLAQDFELRRYIFDERLRPIEDFSQVYFDGLSSNMAEAVRTLADRFRERPVAGMLLFSDGLATDSLADLLSSPPTFPIYPIITRSATAAVDVSIGEVTTNLSSFELAPATVEARVRASGLNGSKLSVRLLDEHHKTLEQRTIQCDKDEFEQLVRFRFRPEKPGLQFVNLVVMLQSEEGELKKADEAARETAATDESVENHKPLVLTSRKEVTTANNQILVKIDRGGGPFKVLYVSGRPNWEFKFLRRALEEDVEMELSALVRIAKEEPKFSFRDRGVETANPLMAGFSDDAETAEQYDEPVLLPIGGVDADELRSGFPSSPESLFAYDAIVLDDIEAKFFTQAQMLLIREFVSSRGGGLMMLGGQESYSGGAYKDTPLEDLLPVYISDQDIPADQRIRYQLSRSGTLEPWLRLRTEAAEEEKRLAAMPDFRTWHQLKRVKPGAQVLAELKIQDQNTPGLVAQRFGKGRTLASAIGDWWRWSMYRQEEEDDELGQQWRQIARWLTNDSPKRLSAEVLEPKSSAEPHRIAITLLDEEFTPLDNANIRLNITLPRAIAQDDEAGKSEEQSGDSDDAILSVVATASPDQRGKYFAEVWSRIDGAYRCKVIASTPDGTELDPITIGWTAAPSRAEFQRVTADFEILEQIADKTEGEVVELNQLEGFSKGLPSKKVPIEQWHEEPVWHQPWLIFIALACLGSEWFLRRIKGLA